MVLYWCLLSDFIFSKTFFLEQGFVVEEMIGAMKIRRITIRQISDSSNFRFVKSPFLLNFRF